MVKDLNKWIRSNSRDYDFFFFFVWQGMGSKLLTRDWNSAPCNGRMKFCPVMAHRCLPGGWRRWKQEAVFEATRTPGGQMSLH